MLDCVSNYLQIVSSQPSQNYVQAAVNYNVHKRGRQAYKIDVDGVAGRLITPEHNNRKVDVLDLRSGGVPVTF